jgi:hypothetical protein
MTAHIQFEILRFIVEKLKIWACEILGQIKFMELVYGDEQIASQY